MHVRGRSLPISTYRRRRQEVLKLAREAAGAAVPVLVLGIPETDVATSIQPQVGKRRQDPWFDWFCGCHEPQAALLLDPQAARKQQLFLDPGDPERVIWDGARLQPGAAAKRLFAVDAARPIMELRATVEAATQKCGGRLAMLSRTREPGFQAQQFEVWKRRLRGVRLINIEPAIVHLRMRKDADEIRLHKKAVGVTRAGLHAVFKNIRSYRSESQIAAELLRHYLGAGHDPLAFASIVGAGVNAATLHYPHNDQRYGTRTCVLIDSGASAGGYAADVTRTVPSHGRFDQARFRELYQLVLQAQRLGIRHARPGITWKEWNELAWQPIIDAGFPRRHGLGHHLGLDTHDPADLERPFEPGMLLTCEPGIYLPEEAIGIRIEDNLLITEGAPEVTTRSIAKSIKQLEGLCT